MKRSRRHSVPALKALYSIPELADLADVSRWTMGRMLIASGVAFVSSGRTRYVPLAELEKKFKEAWDSIKERVSHYDLAD